MTRINNPILPGFNPDPSICRVDDDYYIATSTFEWYPGVQIHHSRDLKHWQLAARPLNRPDLLNMLGNPDSCGIYAPCLTHHDGLFYLVYTDVKRFNGSFKDTPNYLTCCDQVDGRWSEPVYLNSSGFDPSLFHDDDRRKWLVNMVWDHCPDRSFFRGIVLQEYSVDERRLVGEAKLIFEGTKLDRTEAPHLYKEDGYYYLMTAEGGTGYEHAITMARSKNIEGPYEVDPAGPLLTSVHVPENPLQRAGHGDFVAGRNGELYLVHLCSRPLPGNARRSPLGRESALQRIEKTDDGWFRLISGDNIPASTVVVDLPEAPIHRPEVHKADFDSAELPVEFQWLRTPWPQELFSLTERKGYLRLFGMESIGSLFKSSLVARRQEHHSYVAATCVEFYPTNFQHMAGLVCYYNSAKFHYLYLGFEAEIGRHLSIISCEADHSLAATFPIWNERIPIDRDTPIEMKADVNLSSLVFSWRYTGETWREVPITLDMSLLSDEAGAGEGAQFTGAFVGICCQDLTGTRRHADFDYFSYRPGQSGQN